jgi:hypothetical protein
MYNNQCVMVTGGGIYGQQGYYPQQQTGLYQTPYYNYPVSTYPYGYGYSSYGYGYGGGCRVGSALGGFINYYTCGY